MPAAVARAASALAASVVRIDMDHSPGILENPDTPNVTARLARFNRCVTGVTQAGKAILFAGFSLSLHSYQAIENQPL
jgi:hypothetical protein